MSWGEEVIFGDERGVGGAEGGCRLGWAGKGDMKGAL